MPELILPTKTKTLEEKLGTPAFDELFNLIQLVTSRIKKEIQDEQEHAHEKIELRFEKKLSEVEAKLTNEIKESKNELKLEIAQNKAEIIKWMFIFLIGSVFTILAGLFGLLKLFVNP